MGIHTGWWDSQRTILVWTFEGTWGWDEFNRHLLACHQEARALGHRYDAISDMSRCYLLPAGAVTRAHLAAKYAPANLGAMVVVGLRPIFSASVRAFRRIHPRLAGDLYTTNTMQEAITLVERLRAAPARAESPVVAAPRLMAARKVTGLLKAAC
jgi:hypothetical protein